MDNPLITPEHKKTELEKIKIHYEHVADNRPSKPKPPAHK